MPTVGWFLALLSASTKFVTQMRFEVRSLYLILTKLGDIIDRFTRNLPKNVKHIQLQVIRHYVTAQSNVFCLIFITISTPISTKFFGQL